MSEFHDHKIVNPLTQNQAREKLRKVSFKQLRDIAQADGLPLSHNSNSQIEIILQSWFPPHKGDGPISFPEMLDMAERMPKGQRPVWRKQTHGKELGF